VLRFLLGSVLLFLACGVGSGIQPHRSSLTFGTNGYNANGCVVSDGEVFCWSAMGAPAVAGKTAPRLGPDTAARVEGLPPVSIVRSGLDRVWASTVDAGIFSWGSAMNPAPKHLEGIGSVSALATDGQTACGLIGDEVWCWGENEYGLLDPDAGREVLPPRRIRSGAVDISMNYGLACATLKDGTLSCWGGGGGGPSDPFTDIAYASNNCALNHTGQLWCGLRKVEGVKRLGRRDGAFNTGNCFVLYDGGVECWDFQGDLPARVRIANLSDPVELAVSAYPAITRPANEPHACALQTDASVYCFNIDVPDAGGHLVRGLP
jgi:hypothetical protein